MISPFAAPGIAPRTNSKFSSGLDSITFNRWTVTRFAPMCPGKVLPFPDTRRIGTSTHRTGMTMEHRTMRFRTAGIIMPLHYPLKSLALRNTDDIHPVALFEHIDFDGSVRPSRHRLFETLAAQRVAGACCLLQVPQLGLGQLALFHFAKRQLDRLITITLFRLDRDDTARTGLNHGHRRKTASRQTSGSSPIFCPTTRLSSSFMFLDQSSNLRA